MDDALSKPFDFMVCGTGMCESTLAAALANAGYRVIQVDKNEVYGTDWQSLNLKTLHEFCQSHAVGEHTQFPDQCGDPTMEEFEFNDKYDGFMARVVTAPSEELMKQYRDFAIDLTPALVTSRGFNVDVQARNGVSQYMGYKTMDNLFMCYGDKGTYKFQRVPCHKSDIFHDSSVGLLDKRRLMKFIEFAIDYQVASEGQSVETVNEARLQQGRSLSRPQNKKASYTFSEDEQQLPFGQFLKDRFKLSPWMQQVVSHGVAQIPSSLEGSKEEAKADADTTPSYSSKDGMAFVSDFLRSIGRYGSTPYLAPLYGCGDIPQAFARFAAVNGAIQLLGTTPRLATRVNPDNEGDKEAAAETEGNEAQVGNEGEEGKTSASNEDKSVPPQWTVYCKGNRFADGDENEEITVKVGHIIAHPSYVPQFVQRVRGSEGTLWACRMVCVVDAPLFPLSMTRNAQGATGDEEILRRGGGRGVAVLPPAAAGEHAVFIVQSDSSVNVAPPGHYVLYFSVLMEGSTEAVMKKAEESLERVASTMCSFPTTPSPREGEGEGAGAGEGAGGDAGEGREEERAGAGEGTKGIPQVQASWIVWQSIFAEGDAPEGVFVALESSPKGHAAPRHLEIGCDTPTITAKQVFTKVLPNTPFLPGKVEEEQLGATETDLREIDELVPEKLIDQATQSQEAQQGPEPESPAGDQ